MVLDLHVPREWSEAEILKMVPTLLCYALSFLIVAIYWVNHHHLIHLVQSVDNLTLWMNIHLLFWMSLMPWGTACLGKYHDTPGVVALYGAIALACSGSFLLLRSSIARQHARDERMRRWHRRMQNKNLVALGIYATAIPLACWSPAVALGLIGLPAVMYFLPDRQVSHG